MSKDKPAHKPQSTENALAREALEALHSIEREAEEKKHKQLERLREAKQAIGRRMEELRHQEAELEAAIARITGKPEKKPGGAGRADHTDLRARVVRWLSVHSGERFNAAQLGHEFPELKGKSVALVLKPALDAGELQKEGQLRATVYFVNKGQGQ